MPALADYEKDYWAPDRDEVLKQMRAGNERSAETDTGWAKPATTPATPPTPAPVNQGAPATASGPNAPKPGFKAEPPAWSNNALPQYAPPGFDQTKWNNQEWKTDKYTAGRMLAQGASAEEVAAKLGWKLLSPDKIQAPDGSVFDTYFDYGGPQQRVQWTYVGGGPDDTGGAGGGTGGGGGGAGGSGVGLPGGYDMNSPLLQGWNRAFTAPAMTYGGPQQIPLPGGEQLSNPMGTGMPGQQNPYAQPAGTTGGNPATGFQGTFAPPNQGAQTGGNMYYGQPPAGPPRTGAASPQAPPNPYAPNPADPLAAGDTYKYPTQAGQPPAGGGAMTGGNMAQPYSGGFVPADQGGSPVPGRGVAMPYNGQAMAGGNMTTAGGIPPGGTPTPSPGFQAPPGTQNAAGTPFNPYGELPGAPQFTYGDFQARPEFQAPSGEEVFSDPGYQFRKNEAEQAFLNSAAAQGTMRSGGTLKDFLKYGQEMASQEYGNVYQRRANEYDRAWQNQMQGYTTNRDTAQMRYEPQVLDWQTRNNDLRRNQELAYDRAWREYQNQQDVFYQNQQNMYDRLYGTAGMGLNAV